MSGPPDADTQWLPFLGCLGPRRGVCLSHLWGADSPNCTGLDRQLNMPPFLSSISKRIDIAPDVLFLDVDAPYIAERPEFVSAASQCSVVF